MTDELESIEYDPHMAQFTMVVNGVRLFFNGMESGDGTIRLYVGDSNQTCIGELTDAPFTALDMYDVMDKMASERDLVGPY